MYIHIQIEYTYMYMHATKIKCSYIDICKYVCTCIYICVNKHIIFTSYIHICRWNSRLYVLTHVARLAATTGSFWAHRLPRCRRDQGSSRHRTSPLGRPHKHKDPHLVHRLYIYIVFSNWSIYDTIYEVCSTWYICCMTHGIKSSMIQYLVGPLGSFCRWSWGIILAVYVDRKPLSIFLYVYLSI